MSTAPEKLAAGQQTHIPLRQDSHASSATEPAVGDHNPLDTSALLTERLQAWKHAVGYLEDYIEATEKVQKAHAKEYEKVLKTISDPLREGAHFDQTLGGVAGLFENLRSNTEGLSNSHAETAKNLKGSVLPILERLHKEIKSKSKELESGVGKGAKEVEKARNVTQKQIELMGQQTAGFESSSAKIHPAQDPYVTQRGVYYRLNKQILEENNNRQDLISVQENFAAFEAHVVEVIQQALASFVQYVGGQAQRVQTMYTDMLTTAQRVPPDFEWNGFVQRNQHVLIDPNSGPRTVDSVPFPNQNHKSTQPLIEGTIERKSRSILSGGYTAGHYAVTASLFLHGFKDNDNIRKDPQPEISIYLPDAIVGSSSGDKFQVKGKDVSKGLSSKLAGTSELHFKAHTAADAEKWVEVIKMAINSKPDGHPEPQSPISPIQKSSTGTIGAIAATKPAAIQTTGITGGETVTSPTAVTPAAAPVVATGEKSAAGPAPAPAPTAAPVVATGEKSAAAPAPAVEKS